MRPSLLIVLGTAIAALAAAAPEAPAFRQREVPLDAPPVGADQSPNVDLHRHEKRGLCIYLLGICLGLGSPGYDDVANCGTGALDKICAVNGASSNTCSAGVCLAKTCQSGLTLTSSGTCVDLASDPTHCGAVDSACAVPGAQTQVCSQGVCSAGTCMAGLTHTASGACIDLATDASNCGTLGNVCEIPNSATRACVGGHCSASSCQAGYGLVGGSCTNLASDTANCGVVGNVCQLPGGAGSCIDATCTFTSCTAPFYLVGGACTKLDLQNDPQNCGRVGATCSVANGTPACSGGSCGIAECDPGFELTQSGGILGIGSRTACTAINTSTDPKNCGALGNACQFVNGAGTCQAGTCTYTSCSSGYYEISNVCVALDLNSDIQNCGSVANQCVAEHGVPACVGGKCKLATCDTGYEPSSSGSLTCSPIDFTSNPNYCGNLVTACPISYANGGSASCTNGVCTTRCDAGFAFDAQFQFCRPVLTDASNCGALGKKCAIQQATTQACEAGGSACAAVDTASDPQNCGTIGNVCAFLPTGAAGTCAAGVCTYTSCPAGYTLASKANACVLNPSGRARAKRHQGPQPKTLCPMGEQACPIAGAGSFEGAVLQLSLSGSPADDLLRASGGYECLDTQRSLESCGGCASTGHGRDCTAIPHVGNVTCEAGVCVVVSCARHYRPARAGDRCVRADAPGGADGEVAPAASARRKRSLTGVQHHRSHDHAGRHLRAAAIRVEVPS
ncbi:hypothetical protein JCM8202v2_005910 [Rhodotorula sphaerocarpa]